MGARLKKILSSGMFQGLLLVALVYAAPFAWKAEWFQALFFPVQFHEKKTRDLQNAYRAYALQLRNCPMVRNRAEVDIALDQKKTQRYGTDPGNLRQVAEVQELQRSLTCQHPYEQMLRIREQYDAHISKLEAARQN